MGSVSEVKLLCFWIALYLNRNGFIAQMLIFKLVTKEKTFNLGIAHCSNLKPVL